MTSASAATGAIAGTVTNPEGGVQREALVRVFSFDAAQDAWVSIGGAETQADGTYSLSVPEGTYRVGFMGGYRYADEYAFDSRDVESADDVVVGGGETAIVDAQLGYGGVIEGRVTDSDGVGIETMDVNVYQQVDSEWVRVTDVETGSSGHYRATGLDSGTYRLQARNRSAFVETYYKNAATIEDADDVEVTFGETTSGIDFQPAEQGRFTGIVTDAAGAPLANVAVTLYELDEGAWRDVNGVRTRADGSYRIHAPHTGAYRIGFGDVYGEDLYVEEYFDDSASIEAAHDVSVVVHEETSGIDAQLARHPDVEEPEEPTDPEDPTVPEEPDDDEPSGLAGLLDGIVQLLRSLLQR